MKDGRLRRAFLNTIPVLSGYLMLGMGFGILLRAAGYGPLWALGMSVVIYGGSIQYVMVDLMASRASLVTVAVTTLLVNARHLFYGITMSEPYQNIGPWKPYLIFGLTDETYALVSADHSDGKLCFFITLLDHCYWITGCVLGALLGSILPFSTEGVDFVLTALFLTIFTDQWLNSKNHLSAVIGAAVSAACVLLFGADNFLLPAMALICAALLAVKPKLSEEEAHE